MKCDDYGKLDLNGDTGVRAGVKDELASIIGEVRMIPLFDPVGGNGNNATFTIVRFEGVCILDVQLTGKPNKKKVMNQPAKDQAVFIVAFRSAKVCFLRYFAEPETTLAFHSVPR